MSNITLSQIGYPFAPFGVDPCLLPNAYQLVADAVTKPVSLAEAKLACKVDEDDTSEDDLFNIYISAATNFAEQYTGRDLINKSYIAYLDFFPNFNVTYVNNDIGAFIQIQKSLLQSITSIQYYSDNVLTTFNPSNYYKSFSNDYSNIYIVNGASWPSDADVRKQSVQITFVAGYGASASNVPNDFREAILQHIAQMYANRGDCSDMGVGATIMDTMIASTLPEQAKLVYDMRRIRLISHRTFY
jgi:uncharacterized phiE125 gp8 family phage protein